MELQQKALALELGLAKLQSNLSAKQINELDLQFEDVYINLLPTPHDYQARKTAVDFVNGLARGKLSVGDERKRHGVCHARAFGSFTMDMFTPTSDLDISLNVERGSESLARQDGVSLLKKMTKFLYKLQSNGVVRDIQPVFKAKVPVVKFIHCSTGIECDISVENREGIIKSELLRIFSSIDSRFRKLCFLLKAWANAHGINSSKDNTLNSLSIILLVALHLQTRVPAILPPFSVFLKGVNSPIASNAAPLIERHVNAYKNFGKNNNETVVQLFSSFLTKIMAVKDLWIDGLCASAYEGTWTLTTSPSWIFVEDFTALSQNAARAVNGVGFEAIYECCNQALAHLKEYCQGVHAARLLKRLLFDLHIGSSVHKRKRKKESHNSVQGSLEEPVSRLYYSRPAEQIPARALSHNSIQGSLDPISRLYNSRPVEQIPAPIRRIHFDTRDSLTQVGRSSVPHYVIPSASMGLVREHPAKRLKSQDAHYGDDFRSTFADQQALPDKSVMVPSQAMPSHRVMPSSEAMPPPQLYSERHSRQEDYHYHNYIPRRPPLGEPRSYMPPISTVGMHERRHVLDDRAAGVSYAGPRGVKPLPPPISGTGNSLYAESLRGLNQLAYSNLVPGYGYGARLHDRF